MTLISIIKNVITVAVPYLYPLKTSENLPRLKEVSEKQFIS